MINKDLFDRSVSRLVAAYSKGDLLHFNCTKCAVGVLCCYNGQWSKLFHTKLFGEQLFFSGYLNDQDVIDCIVSSGYTYQQLMRVETAFENAYNNSRDPDGYFGMMAVMDVLMEIHEADPGRAKQLKEMFTKPQIQFSTTEG